MNHPMHVLSTPTQPISSPSSPLLAHPVSCQQPVAPTDSNQPPSYFVALMQQYNVPPVLMEMLESHRMTADWKGLCDCISTNPDWMHVTFVAYFDIIPAEYRYDFLIECHVYGGDKLSAVRKEMRKIRTLRKPILPPELDGQDVITVYRAGDEPIEKAAYRLSWTISKEKAQWFMKYSGYHKCSDMHLYEGTIARDKVLVYTDQRDEKEIIQYGSVKNIKEIGFMTLKELLS